MLAGVRQRLVGEIFDSCPCYMYTEGGLSMIELGTKRWLARMLLKAGYMSQCVIAGSLSILGNNPTLAEEYWQHCEAWPTSCRQARRAAPLHGKEGGRAARGARTSVYGRVRAAAAIGSQCALSQGRESGRESGLHERPGKTL